MIRNCFRSCLILALMVAPGAALAQNDMADVEMKTVPVTEGVYMLMGRGGNIGVSAGDDGVFLIDDEYAPLTEKIRAAIAAISDQPIRFLLNTHWHGDHTGGNENLGKAGIVIVAHDNVRKRMSTKQFIAAFNREVPAAPRKALPVITFGDRVTFHINGATVVAFHVEDAHTDGDVIIHFHEADVYHMGDVFFNGMFPFIDLSSGGSIDGMIAASEMVLARSKATTKLIPGHGPLAGKDDLADYVAMLKTVRQRVGKAIAKGTSVEDFVASNPLADLVAKWGKGFLNAERFTRIVYEDLSRK